VYSYVEMGKGRYFMFVVFRELLAILPAGLVLKFSVTKSSGKIARIPN